MRPLLSSGDGCHCRGTGRSGHRQFREQPLELSISPDLSAATIIGSYGDAFFSGVQTEGDQETVFISLMLSGELPDPEELTLEIAFARDMGANWRGDRDGLTLELTDFSATDGLVSLSGTVTGNVSGGPDSETRPVTLSFDARLEQVN
ncbi:hypothetical protein ACFSZS_29995 [Seohaeicola zhoushanensis]